MHAFPGGLSAIFLLPSLSRALPPRRRRSMRAALLGRTHPLLSSFPSAFHQLGAKNDRGHGLGGTVEETESQESPVGLGTKLTFLALAPGLLVPTELTTKARACSGHVWCPSRWRRKGRRERKGGGEGFGKLNKGKERKACAPLVPIHYKQCRRVSALPVIPPAFCANHHCCTSAHRSA
eukprot:3652410-Rhodomonas_salina.2